MLSKKNQEIERNDKTAVELMESSRGNVAANDILIRNYINKLTLIKHYNAYAKGEASSETEI